MSNSLSRLCNVKAYKSAVTRKNFDLIEDD